MIFKTSNNTCSSKVLCSVVLYLTFVIWFDTVSVTESCLGFSLVTSEPPATPTPNPLSRSIMVTITLFKTWYHLMFSLCGACGHTFCLENETYIEKWPHFLYCGCNLNDAVNFCRQKDVQLERDAEASPERLLWADPGVVDREPDWTGSSRQEGFEKEVWCRVGCVCVQRSSQPSQFGVSGWIRVRVRVTRFLNLKTETLIYKRKSKDSSLTKIPQWKMLHKISTPPGTTKKKT